MPRIWNKVIGETCAALPLEQLASLDVSASQMTEQMWLRRFGKLTHLRSICAQGMAIHMLLSAMIAEPGITTSASVPTNSLTQNHSCNQRKMPPTVYFPSLHHLTIEDTSFDIDYDHESAELEGLKDCLMEHNERKAEVRKLTLSQCHRLTAEHVDKLEEIVVDVIKWCYVPPNKLQIFQVGTRQTPALQQHSMYPFFPHFNLHIIMMCMNRSRFISQIAKGALLCGAYGYLYCTISINSAVT
ncbi:uncharacterized protein LACBIDRAFT_334942 [Laccaria bicolor S238N-H82]|uniref:Predicted protein n=1 Tax=Laccaria bicolor (strain S238N-H82 / ATCC MYA-4686) TaxID=486041 RepID=B0E0V0_LACBS|nr:uncharacterized protein LACBIDRAFT_334942 [Laccaria bicolor S238N-H82]EDQ99508.1 predicted protein [Laccaria bicolor S238N-H82]|eukprot:XP_001889857.1 predicted protein [Laccaria bicolor S238N-H82]